MRDLTLECKHIIQIPIVFLCPNLRIVARINQLDVYVDPARVPAHASLKHVSHIQRATDVLCIACPAIFGDTVVFDHLQIGELRQFGQNTIVNAVGEKRVFFIWTEAFKGQHSNAGSRVTVLKRNFTFPNQDTDGCPQRQQKRGHSSNNRIAS